MGCVYGARMERRNPDSGGWERAAWLPYPLWQDLALSAGRNKRSIDGELRYAIGLYLDSLGHEPELREAA